MHSQPQSKEPTTPSRHGWLFSFFSGVLAYRCALLAPGSILLSLLVPIGAFLAARLAAWVALRQGWRDYGHQAALLACGFFLVLLVLCATVQFITGLDWFRSSALYSVIYMTAVFFIASAIVTVLQKLYAFARSKLS
jgi:hypothetical protein